MIRARILLLTSRVSQGYEDGDIQTCQLLLQGCMVVDGLYDSFSACIGFIPVLILSLTLFCSLNFLAVPGLRVQASVV